LLDVIRLDIFVEDLSRSQAELFVLPHEFIRTAPVDLILEGVLGGVLSTIG